MRRFTLAILTLALTLPALGAFGQEADEVEAKPAEVAAPVAESAETAAADAASAAAATAPEAKSLEELLELIKQGFREERNANAEREKRFRAARDEQAKLLADAQAQQARAEDLSQRLEAAFQQNELALAEREATLADRLGTLGELFGVVRQVAGDARGNFQGSLTSAQLPEDRDVFLEELGKKKALPDIASLERLWYELSREMTEQGRVVRFEAPVLAVEGGEVRKEVVRAGVFSALADGSYLLWDPDIQKLRELNRQPPPQYLSTVASFEETQSGMEMLAVDPSRGSLLAVLIDTRNLWERIPEGGGVGYTIIGLGAIAALIALIRMAMIAITSRKVAAQQKSPAADDGNPLGRVLSVYEANREADTETLELKLDEAVMRETSKLERFIWLVKVVSVVAPLLGLLGTVTGMIATFQSITLFGAGDPRMMASGISEALVTTMLGLFVAIPLVLLHAALASNTKRILAILDEQSAGLIARQSERANA
jgi:biopolymer transport protein ExbB